MLQCDLVSVIYRPICTTRRRAGEGTVAGRCSLQSHGQFDVVGERNRKIIARRGPDAGKVFRAVIRVVGDDESTATQAAL